MTNPQENTGAFARAFLPGLVLGLIIGGVTGAVLPELVGNRPPSPQPSSETDVQPRQSQPSNGQQNDRPIDRDEQQTPQPETPPAVTPPPEDSQPETPGGF